MSATADGMTLLELLIAVVIFSVLVAFSYRIVNVGVTSEQVTSIHAERLSAIQFAAHLMVRDIMQLQPRRTFRINMHEAHRSGLIIDNDSIDFIRGGVLSTRHASLERVRYIRDHDKIMRVSWAVFDGVAEENGKYSLILAGVRDMKVVIVDTYGIQHRRWPVADNITPRYLELTITLNDVDTISRLIPIPYLGPIVYE